MVLGDLAIICVKAWYLCKEHLAIRKVGSIVIVMLSNCMWTFVKEVYGKFHKFFFVFQDCAKDHRSIKKEVTIPILEVWLIVWVVSSSYNWKCMFGQWAHVASTILQLLIGLAQLLTGLESPKRDWKSPKRDSYVLNVVIDS